MLRQPLRTYAVLVPSLVVAFAFSAAGGDRTAGDGGLYYLGAAGWVAFCLLLLATLVFSLVIGVRAIGRRSSGSAWSSS